MMTVNPQMAHRIMAWFDKQGVAPKCVVCGSLDWETYDHIMMLPCYDTSPREATASAVGGNMQIAIPSGPAAPMVIIVCKQCAATMMFSAAEMGVL